MKRLIAIAAIVVAAVACARAAFINQRPLTDADLQAVADLSISDDTPCRTASTSILPELGMISSGGLSYQAAPAPVEYQRQRRILEIVPSFPSKDSTAMLAGAAVLIAMAFQRYLE